MPTVAYLIPTFNTTVEIRENSVFNHESAHKWTDGCYQVHYLPRFAADKNPWSKIKQFSHMHNSTLCQKHEQMNRHTDSGDLSPTRTCVPYVLLAIVWEQLLHHQFFKFCVCFQWTTKTKNHQGPLNFSKNIVSLVHRGAFCALVVHIAPSWCTSSPYTVVVVYNVPWVHPGGLKQ